MESKIREIEERALTGDRITRDEIIELLEIDPESQICDRLGEAAFRVAKKVSGETAYLWAAFGVDYKPCSMNCRFCSLGEAWKIVDVQQEFSDEEIIDNIWYYAENGVRWIVLRTTEFYSLSKLEKLIRKIREAVHGDYEIGLNVGEFDEEQAQELYRCGVQFIYHSLRLGEGRDTNFDPNIRLQTLRAVKNSPLKLVFLVEPIGVEHSNDEIADLCLLTMDYEAIVSGAMARIPVEGTPLGKYPQISERRLAQIIAVIRLACGTKIKDICVHPVSETAVKWGANVTVVESGAVPRDCRCITGGRWKDFDIVNAKEMFEKYGYQVRNKGN